MSASNGMRMKSKKEEFPACQVSDLSRPLFTLNTSDRTNQLSNLENFPTGISDPFPETASTLHTTSPSPFVPATETPVFDWSTAASATHSKIETTELQSLLGRDLSPCFRCGEAKVLTFHDFGQTIKGFPVHRGKGMTCSECIYAACSVGHCIHPTHRPVRVATPRPVKSQLIASLKRPRPVKSQLIASLKRDIEALTKEMESLSSQDD